MERNEDITKHFEPWQSPEVIKKKPNHSTGRLIFGTSYAGIAGGAIGYLVGKLVGKVGQAIVKDYNLDTINLPENFVEICNYTGSVATATAGVLLVLYALRGRE